MALFVPFFHTGNKFNSVPLTKGLAEGDAQRRRRSQAGCEEQGGSK